MLRFFRSHRTTLAPHPRPWSHLRGRFWPRPRLVSSVLLSSDRVEAEILLTTRPERKSDKRQHVATQRLITLNGHVFGPAQRVVSAAVSARSRRQAVVGPTHFHGELDLGYHRGGRWPAGCRGGDEDSGHKKVGVVCQTHCR